MNELKAFFNVEGIPRKQTEPISSLQMKFCVISYLFNATFLLSLSCRMQQNVFVGQLALIRLDNLILLRFSLYPSLSSFFSQSGSLSVNLSYALFSLSPHPFSSGQQRQNEMFRPATVFQGSGKLLKYSEHVF